MITVDIKILHTNLFKGSLTASLTEEIDLCVADILNWFDQL